jgi:hypothetical protein
VVLDVVARVLAGDRGWLGILTGENAPALDGVLTEVRSAHPELEIAVHEGGSPTTRSCWSRSDPGRRDDRVLLVEDSDVYRESLVFLLGRVPGIEVVGSVATGGSAASACVELRRGRGRHRLPSPDVDGRRQLRTFVTLPAGVRRVPERVRG